LDFLTDLVVAYEKTRKIHNKLNIDANVILGAS